MGDRREHILKHVTLYLNLGVQSFYYGGQAVLSGVMMRGRDKAWVVVRDQQGNIHEQSRALESAWLKKRFFKLPLVRGVIILIQSMVLGVWALGYSSTVAYPEEEALDTKSIVISMVLAAFFAIGLFIVLPFGVSRFFDGLVTGWIQNVLEGVFRIGVLIVYMILIGKNSEIEEVFEFHGAEHKAINAFESKLSGLNDGSELEVLEQQASDELTLTEVMDSSRVHTRCGTSFLVVVALLSIIAFSMIGRPTELIHSLGYRIVLIPLVGAISYELIRFSARHACHPLIRAMTQPGMWVQGLTTREPSETQAEVAIAALRRATH